MKAHFRFRLWPRKSWLVQALLGVLFGSLAAMTLSVHGFVALADTPAVTDFGQADVVPASMMRENGWRQAVFVTLYPDGSGKSEVRGVRDDAENTLLSEHPSWQLDHSLTWFVQMPVYVRQLSIQDTQTGACTV